MNLNINHIDPNTGEESIKSENIKDTNTNIISLFQRKNLSELLFPNTTHNIEYYEDLYPKRIPGEVITRYAPSPTWFMHIGNFYTAYIAERIAHQNNGKFLLRIEDTDKQREISWGIESIIKSLNTFWLKNDEGIITDSHQETWEHWPYIQSMRKDIYSTVVKSLIEQGLAYPCFMTIKEIDEIRKEQTESKLPIGIYKGSSKRRDANIEEIKKKILNKTPYVIRLKSPWEIDKKIKIIDEIKGELNLSEYFHDVVLIKIDGLPTYHLTHVVDDHFMRTSHITRSDERLPSLPLHIQLFNIMGWEIPKYLHISPILKEENGKKRKISKRKDPEANLEYFTKKGYQQEALKGYLLTIIDSWYETRKKENPKAKTEEFKIDYNNMSKSGALFDEQKLESISQNQINNLSLDEFFNLTKNRAKEHNPKLYDYIIQDEKYFKLFIWIDILEGKGLKRFKKISDVENLLFFLDDEYTKTIENNTKKEKIISEDIKNTIETYVSTVWFQEDKELWFEDLKKTCEKHGFVSNKKVFTEWKDKGIISDITTAFKFILTWSEKAPDLFGLIKIMGTERVYKRIKYFIANY